MKRQKRSLDRAQVQAIAVTLPAVLLLACLQTAPSDSALAKSRTLPKAFQQSVLDQMGQASMMGRESLRITQSSRTRWKDCLHPSADQFLEPSCKPVERSGWRVTVQGGTESWTYYVTSQGLALLDAPASLNPQVRKTIETTMGRPDFSILAAEPYAIADTSSCTNPMLCKVRPRPGWKVLVANAPRLLYLDYQGKPMPVGDFRGMLPSQPTDFPKRLGAAALRDLSDRLRGLPANFKVDSVQTITWSLCGGGGPTPPPMGMCPVGTIEGWRLRASGAGIQWVYYWTKGTEREPNPTASPDGLQSLPPSVSQAVLRDVAEVDRLPVTQYRVQGATALFTNRCLNRDEAILHCRQGIQAGWDVAVVGGQAVERTHTFSSPISNYLSNLEGTDVRLVARGTWAPPP